MSKKADKYLELSQQLLTDFDKAKKADVSSRTLYNRLYYACFNAANAVLASKDLEAKTHAGVADKLFTEIYEDSDLISKQTAAFLSIIQTKRDISDYELEMKEDKEELKEIETEAKEFIEQMREVVKSNR